MDDRNFTLFFQYPLGDGWGKDVIVLQFLDMFANDFIGRNLIEFLAGVVAPEAVSVIAVDEDRIADAVQNRQEIFDGDAVNEIVFVVFLQWIHRGPFCQNLDTLL